MGFIKEIIGNISDWISEFSMKDLWEGIKNLITDLSTEEITLISILVTLMIFYIGNRSEVRFKKLESRREEYKKFITVL